MLYFVEYKIPQIETSICFRDTNWKKCVPKNQWNMVTKVSKGTSNYPLLGGVPTLKRETFPRCCVTNELWVWHSEKGKAPEGRPCFIWGEENAEECGKFWVPNAGVKKLSKWILKLRSIFPSVERVHCSHQKWNNHPRGMNSQTSLSKLPYRFLVAPGLDCNHNDPHLGQLVFL